jgi:hypothetical protein
VCPNDAIEYAGGAGGAGGGSAGAGGFASRAPPPGRGLNVASLPPVKCYRCGGPNHMARYAYASSRCAALIDSSYQGLFGSAVCRHGGYERRKGARQDVLQMQERRPRA